MCVCVRTVTYLLVCDIATSTQCGAKDNMKFLLDRGASHESGVIPALSISRMPKQTNPKVELHSSSISLSVEVITEVLKLSLFLFFFFKKRLSLNSQTESYISLKTFPSKRLPAHCCWALKFVFLPLTIWLTDLAPPTEQHIPAWLFCVAAALKKWPFPNPICKCGNHIKGCP